MLDKNVVKSWFVTKAKPVQNQFAQWIDASWFKGEQLDISDVNGLSDALLNSQLPIASTIALLNATDDMATFAAPQSTIIVKDQQRGGVFIKYTGADAADGGRIFQDANSNKWKRQTQDEKINVAWYGVLGDGTDESTKIQAMINALSGVVHLVWNNKTYRFYGIQVGSAVTNLTMEFNGTTWCYPLRNSGTTPVNWYRFFDSVGQQNYQINLIDIPKVLLKGSLVLDGERRLGNSFNTLNNSNNPYNGEGLAPIIKVDAYNLAINSLVTIDSKAVVAGKATVTSDGFGITNSAGVSFQSVANLTFKNKSYYKYLVRFTLTLSSGTIYPLWDTDGTIHSPITEGEVSIPIYPTFVDTIGTHTLKLWSKDATVGTITNLRVEEIAPTHFDNYFKTAGDFKMYDHGFSALGMNTNASPAYNLVDINDWTWFKTVFGGMRIMGNHNTIRLNNFFSFDKNALSFEEPIFNGNNVRGISVTPFDFADTNSWPNIIHISNWRLKYTGGYTLVYACKELIWENTMYEGWGKYIGVDGIERNLGEDTGSVYDIKSAVGGPAYKIDPTYWTEYYKITFRNITCKNTSVFQKTSGANWFLNLWFQSGAKNVMVEDCKFDGLVKPTGQGDYDPTSQSWSHSPIFNNCEFTENSRIIGGYRFNNCRWTRKAIMKTPIVDYPFPKYTDVVEGIVIGGLPKVQDTLYGGGITVRPIVYNNCDFIARSVNGQMIDCAAEFHHCNFTNGSCVYLTGSYDSINSVEFSRNFDLRFFDTRRVVIALPPVPSSTNKANCKGYFENSEVILAGYTGNIADLTNAASDLRKIFDCSTYRWNNLKIYDAAGNLLHDLKGFEWLTEPTSTSSYGLEGAYYETATKRYDYKSGAWVIVNKSNLLSSSATLDYASIAAGGSQDLTIPLTGADLGDTINIGLPASAPVGLVFNAFVSAAGVVTLRATNITAAAIDAGSDTYKVSINK